MIRKFYQSLFAFVLALTLSLGSSIAQAPADSAAATPAATGGGGDIAKGEEIFKNNCAQCHATTADVVVGPGLAGIEDRRDFAWLVKWIHNPMGVVNSGDKYAVDLYNKFNKTQMTAFPNISEGDIRAMLDYVKVANEAKPAAATANAAAAQTAETGGGKFFNTVIVTLLVIMGLILLALLGVLRLLGKLTGFEKTEGVQTTSWKDSLKNIFANKTVRSAIIWTFILLASKATFDGLYGIGVHQGYAPKQPISFSHKLHAGNMKINCSYCHTGVYTGKQAGIPSPNICMNCHNSIKRESPEIQKIYTALEKDQPIEWVRVHNLPDLAYFNHAQHTNVAGLDCKNCHGDIEKMEVVEQRSTLTMGWCIDCHRKTEVNGKDNAYYDNLMKAHKETHGNKPMRVEDIGGLECAKCHY